MSISSIETLVTACALMQGRLPAAPSLIRSSAWVNPSVLGEMLISVSSVEKSTLCRLSPVVSHPEKSKSTSLTPVLDLADRLVGLGWPT